MMRRTHGTRLAPILGVGLALVFIVGCGRSYPVIPDAKGVSSVTYPSALGNYARVYAMTYKIVNRYSLVKWASYTQGEVVGEMAPDNSLFDKTRRIVHARLFDEGPYWDVEVRVLIETEMSEPDSFGQFQPRFQWRVIGGDPFLETKLNNEIKLALTNNAYLKKHHVSLRPEVEVPAEPQGARPPPVRGGAARGTSSANPPASPGSSQAPDNGHDVSGLVSTDVSGEASYSDLEALGVYYLRSGRYSLASTALRTAVDLRARNPFGWYLLAQSEFANGRFSPSAAAIRRGVENNPEWARSVVEFRSFYGGNAQDFAGHFGRLEQRLRDDSGDEDALLVLGYIYYFSGRHVDALSVFDGLTQSNPEDSVFSHYRRHAQLAIAKASGLEEH